MSTSAKLTWHSKVRERTECEVANSLAVTLNSDVNNVHEDDTESVFDVTITVEKTIMKGEQK